MIARTLRATSFALGAALLVACGSGGDDAADSTVRTPAPTTTEGELFTQVEDGGDPTDTEAPEEGAASTDETTSTSTADSTPDPETADADGDAGGDAPASTAAGQTSGSSSGGSGSTGGTGGGGGGGTGGGGGANSGADGTFGEGGGVVTVDGVAYAFASDFCIIDGGDFIVEGPGTTADGTPFWGSINASSDFDIDGDGTPDETLDIFVEVGKDDVFGSGSEDLPDLSATKLDGATRQIGEDLEYTIAGNRISGSGPIEDFNAVLAPLGETLPMTFEGTCAE